MRREFVPSLSRQTWWWVFGSFIATPAVILALLGLRSIHADEIERQQRLSVQQTQAARLVDAALASALDVERLAAEARDSGGLASGDVLTFEADDNGVVAFPADRVYFGPFGAQPLLLPPPRQVPAAIAAVVEQAQAAEAQQKSADAAALYEKVRADSELRPWTDMRLAVLRLRAGDPSGATMVTDVRWATSDARTPAGIPLAIAASGYSATLPVRARARFGPLIGQTLRSLRAGRWWLSIDQRRAYDAELRRWLADCDAAIEPPVGDAHLDRVAGLEPSIRQILAEPPGGPRRADIVSSAAGNVLLVSPPRDQASRSSTGAAISGSRLAAMLETALRPSLHDQTFRMMLRDRQRAPVWGSLGDATEWKSEPLEALSGWQLAFSGPEPLTASRRGLNYALILLPVVMLASGLVMTAWIVRREMALARLQSQFVAAVTHEFKSPLTSIRLLMERIANGRVGPNDSVARYYTAVGAETDRLEALVNRLLESQKLQTGQKEYAFRPCSLPALARSAVDRLRPQADAKGIQLDCRVESDVPDLPLDRDSVADAIANLVDNAIKYSPAHTQVVVTLQVVDGEARIDVCDQGIGVERAEAGRIFEPFYRNRRGDLENVHGTGLGLSLVKAAAEAHGGSVEVSSDGIRGSRFTMRFPIREHA